MLESVGDVVRRCVSNVSENIDVIGFEEDVQSFKDYCNMYFSIYSF